MQNPSPWVMFIPCCKGYGGEAYAHQQEFINFAPWDGFWP